MALCLKCGAVMDNDDAPAHMKAGCNPADVPTKGAVNRVETKQ